MKPGNIRIILLKGLFTLTMVLTGRVLFSQEVNNYDYNEELYTVTDRDLYFSGESVWIRITLLDPCRQADELSRIVYYDLLGPDNSIAIQKKAEASDGFASAMLRLPDTLSTGTYTIRAYTRWMENFSPDLFSYKAISVINPFENVRKIVTAGQQNSIPDSISFYPEGGRFIKGHINRIGFRSIDKRGKPVKMDGAVINGMDTVSKVFTNEDGYGWADIGNCPGCYLSAEDKNGNKVSFLLPAAEDGVTIKVNESDPSAMLTIFSGPQFTGNSGSCDLVITGPGGRSVTRIVPGKDYEKHISSEDLPEGLFYAAIEGSKSTMAGRWIYNDRSKKIRFGLSTGGEFTRDSIKVKIVASDQNGNPVRAGFSISVVKAFMSGNSLHGERQLPILPQGFNNSINDYLIFYTGNPNLFTLKYTSDGLPVHLPEPEGHLISGNIRRRSSGEPLPRENITLSVVGKTALTRFTKTDSLGNFNFVTDVKGISEIVIQPLSAENNEAYVELVNPYFTLPGNNSHGRFRIDTCVLDQVNRAIISMQVRKIYEPFSQQTAVKTIPVKKPDFYGDPDERIFLADYVELGPVKEVAREIMPAVSVIRKNEKSTFRLINKYLTENFENEPMVLIDGVPVNDMTKVLNVNSRDLERIDVLTTRYFISDIVLEGLLHFVTNKGNLGVIDFDRSVYRLQYDFPDFSSTFVSPAYSSPSTISSKIPDFRNTLFWDAKGRTDAGGRASAEFFASDEPGEYMIIIQGFAEDGSYGSATLPLKIRKK